MTEQTNRPGPNDPPAPQSTSTGNPLSSSDAPMLDDGGALESDGTQWGPKHPPKTDAADNSAAEQTGEVVDEDSATEPGAAAATGAQRRPDVSGEPYLTSSGRASSVSETPGTAAPGEAGGGDAQRSAGGVDAGR